MGQIIINYPDDQGPRIVDAFAATFDYDGYVRNGGTLTRAQYAKFQLVRWTKSVVRAYEVGLRQKEIESTIAPVTDTDLT